MRRWGPSGLLLVVVLLATLPPLGWPASFDQVNTTSTQTLTNKTLTSPVLQGTVGAGTGLTMPALTMGGALLFTDNTYDIGALGATRPRNLYLAGNVLSGGYQGTVIGAAYGGTGVANNPASTLTLSGNFATTVTVTGTTGVTLPTSGTLVTTGVTTLSSLTSIGTITTGTWNGTVVGATYGGTGLNTSASTGVPSVSTGTWAVAATLGPTLGGTGANTSSWNGLPTLNAGVWTQNTVLTATQILYAGASNTVGSSSSFTWNATASLLSVTGTIAMSGAATSGSVAGGLVAKNGSGLFGANAGNNTAYTLLTIGADNNLYMGSNGALWYVASDTVGLVAGSNKQITASAADSCTTGFRCLRVPN